jgi:ribosomal protein L37AE/L43A
VTLTQREDMAGLLGKELAAFLLEEHAAADHQVRPSAKQPPVCPKCQQPSTRVTPADGPLPERELTTRAGEVKLRRQQWRCPKCRIGFFSAGPQAAIGNGALQPAASGEERAPGQQGGLVQGSQ